jgi:hypothetical protein
VEGVPPRTYVKWNSDDGGPCDGIDGDIVFEPEVLWFHP